jgi:hypothetical protein
MVFETVLLPQAEAWMNVGIRTAFADSGSGLVLGEF